MSKLNKDKDSPQTSLTPVARRLLHSTAVVALLFPNFASVGVALAEETPEEESPVEEVIEDPKAQEADEMDAEAVEEEADAPTEPADADTPEDEETAEEPADPAEEADEVESEPVEAPAEPAEEAPADEPVVAPAEAVEEKPSEESTDIAPQQVEDRDEITQLQVDKIYPYAEFITGSAVPNARVDIHYPGTLVSMTRLAGKDGTFSIPNHQWAETLTPGANVRITVRVAGVDYVYNNEFFVAEPREVRTLINVNKPSNMENYSNTLSDFENHPLILTNQVTGEEFRSQVVPDESNSSNDFQLETMVHAYERGNHVANDYDITLPQELIDLGYSLTRDHRIRSNFGIVGSTNLSYNAPQPTENIGALQRNVNDYSYLERQEVQITLTSLDGTRQYVLGSRDLDIPSGEYNVSVTSPSNSRPQLIWRESSLRDAAEKQVELEREGETYVGTINLDFSNSTRPQVLKVSPIPLAETYTVTIDPNGGDINEDFRVTEIEEGETYTLPYAYQLGLERTGFTLAGYTVEGTLLNAAGEPVTEIERFTADYTPVTDVTLTANWVVTTGQFTLTLYDDEVTENVFDVTFTNVETGEAEELPFRTLQPNERISWRNEEMPYGTYLLSIDGYRITEADIRGWKMDRDPVIHEDGTVTVYLEFQPNYSANHATLDIEVEPIAEIYTVNIDPNGGTINEAYESVEITEGETYTLPYAFQSDLARPGYTLTGYTVEGTLLDNNGNPVTELSRYTGTYTPASDVTLTANWEVTRGDFVIQDATPGFRNADRSFVLTDGENSYELTSNRSTNSYREWRAENVPNGEYTLLIDGVEYPTELNYEKVGHPDTQSDVTIDDNGVPAFDLTFEDDSSSTFIRYRVTLNAYEIGVEVRGLDGRRTADVGVVVENEDGVAFEGSFDQYHLWSTNEEVLPGLYTITLTTPEGTVAEINDTAASQVAEATDEENVFTIEVNAASQGNLSRVFGAFRLVEAPVEIEDYGLGLEIRDLNGRRTTDVGVLVTNEEGEVFEGSFNEYAQWLSEQELPVGRYTVTLETPEGTVAEINDTSATQSAVATDEENVFTIDVNLENKGNLSRVFGAFRLVEIEEPEPETDADRYEPVFVDEIVLDLNRGNGKLKNPKTLIENMNEMPGGIKVDYTNLDQIDLSGRTTDTQQVEVTVTYRDGSTDVAEVPLRVIPKEKPQRPGKPIIQTVVKTVVRVVNAMVNMIAHLFSGWF